MIKRAFTLIELIVVIIIVGILAAVGMTQYSLMVEKGRTAGAKTRIGTLRQLAYQYWLENGDMTNIQGADVGISTNCVSTDFYRYSVGIWAPTSTYVYLVAIRCTSGGKTPNASTEYRYYMQYYPSTGASDWYCSMGGSSCFGLPP